MKFLRLMLCLYLVFICVRLYTNIPPSTKVFMHAIFQNGETDGEEIKKNFSNFIRIQDTNHVDFLTKNNEYQNSFGIYLYEYAWRLEDFLKTNFVEVRSFLVRNNLVDLNVNIGSDESSESESGN